MKKVVFALSFIFIVLSSVNAQKTVKNAAPVKTFVTVENTSADGKYKYTTVTNDPLGVRTYKLANGLTVMILIYIVIKIMMVPE